MTSTLTPTCSFCGLRFENRPLLELHIREDHLQRGKPAEPGQGNPPDARASRPHPRSPSSRRGEPATTSRTKAGSTMTGPRRPRRLRAGWVMTGLRRVIGVFRHANAELLLASEVMMRPAGAPRPRQSADPSAEPDAHQAPTGGRADRAA
jgi:hypothetical protein